MINARHSSVAKWILIFLPQFDLIGQHIIDRISFHRIKHSKINLFLLLVLSSLVISYFQIGNPVLFNQTLVALPHTEREIIYLERIFILWNLGHKNMQCCCSLAHMHYHLERLLYPFSAFSYLYIHFSTNLSEIFIWYFVFHFKNILQIYK